MPVSLHTHSWYSLLEGVSSLDALLDRAVACGQTTLALTDTNNLYGVVAFAEKAARRGVRPIFGARLRHGRSHGVALIGERLGYRNLCRVLSRLHLDPTGTVAIPDLLAEFNEGLHVLTADLTLAEWLRPTLGPRLWLEVVRPAPPGRSEKELLEYARRHDLRLVASTAAHFARPSDHATYRLATVVRQGSLVERLPARLAVTPKHCLADEAELGHRFRDLPEAVRNTDLLAEQLRSDVLPRDVVLPPPHLPRNVEKVGYLRMLCERGLRRRDVGEDLRARERLREELALIESAGLSGYFLVVRDVARHARRRGHSMALRGSAGNSLVCYLLEITDVNPLRFGLTLDRFLHPGRTSLPDIDLDFDWKVRDEVIAHVIRRWGTEHAAMISTHQFLQPRSAFRESAKAHGLSEQQISDLLGRLSERAEEMVASAELPADCLRAPPGFPLEPERWPRILNDARLLLGRPHHLSIHPGGVVITPRPLEEYAPLQRSAKGVTVTQFEKDAAEAVGLVKIDLLGNRALATVDEARLHAGAACDVVAPGEDEVLRMLREGDTLGVTQLESPAMRHLLIQMQPGKLEDVVEALALLRPGVAGIGMKERFVRRRRGLDPVGELHPLLEFLRPTQGFMLYEDDALSVLRALTGLAVPDAARLYKRITKIRDDEEGRRVAGDYLAACAAAGLPHELIAEQWVQLSRFRHYTFCKSHAVSYGLIAWRALRLKARHPLAFWTAVLNNNQGQYPTRVYVEAVKRAGIEMRLPCVNRSEKTFTVECGVQAPHAPSGIRVGLGMIASLPEAFVASLLDDRRFNGPYRDMTDLRRRLSPGPRTLAQLIGSGALDFTGRSRPALYLEAELQDRAGGPAAELFGTSADLEGWSPGAESESQRRRDEWRTLGFTLGPPLMSLFRHKVPGGTVSSRDLAAHAGRTVRVAGLVATARNTPTHDGRPMQFVTLEDEWGLIEVSLFPGTCPRMPYLTLGPYLASGTVDDHLGVHALTAREFRPL